jgi:hypothetical protein
MGGRSRSTADAVLANERIQEPINEMHREFCIMTSNRMPNLVDIRMPHNGEARGCLP